MKKLSLFEEFRILESSRWRSYSAQLLKLYLLHSREESEICSVEEG